ncbi:MAG: asparagine synthase (glutamine-hydrolyzing) [Lachnospiraceae bacterium]
MCGIAGFYHAQADYLTAAQKYQKILKYMSRSLRHRGPDEEGIYLGAHAGLAHARLSIIDLLTGKQPMKKIIDGYEVVITYNGEIYNMKALRRELQNLGYVFETQSDTEVVLMSYLAYGRHFVERLNGIFSFAIYDERENCCILYRDRNGIKPLFFMEREKEVIFGSEPKAIFTYPGIQAAVNVKGLNEVFGIGPAKTSGCGVFEGMEEVLPGHYYVFQQGMRQQICYWKLSSREHEDSYEETVEKLSWLIEDAITGQMLSDVPICTFLSGGLDSSLVSAVCAKKMGKQLTTFSFDFDGNQKFFKANRFQPSQDRPWVDKMVEAIHSKHYYLECDNEALVDCLYDSIAARDLPGMADVDASLLYFCREVSKICKVAMTGECADEIFGGYPWFHREECFRANTFPWSMDLEPRKQLLCDDFLEVLHMDEYVQNRYEESLAEVPRLDGESETEARRREITYLNMRWFMQTLLDRMDRTSMYAGLEARVPFADHRIIEYMWNVPWSMKCRAGVEKHLLRKAAQRFLPHDVCYRKKSPYPKTYHPGYEQMLIRKVYDMVWHSDAPINRFLDKKKVLSFIQSPSDYGKPWYGQLMAGPQMLAYLIQVNEWLTRYQIIIKL